MPPQLCCKRLVGAGLWETGNLGVFLHLVWGLCMDVSSALCTCSGEWTALKLTSASAANSEG